MGYSRTGVVRIDKTVCQLYIFACLELLLELDYGVILFKAKEFEYSRLGCDRRSEI